MQIISKAIIIIEEIAAHGIVIFEADIHRLSKMTSTELRSHGIESVHLEVRADDGLAIDSTLPTQLLANSAGRLVSEHESRDGALMVDSSVVLDERVLEGNDYLSLRDLVTELRRAAGRTLLFVR